jgi:AcrR family transcriptional regulator
VTERTEKTREGILKDLARHIFRYGFASLTMEEAASCARVSKRTLYKHYPNKETLLEAILDYQASRFGTIFSGIAADESLDSVAKLSSVLSAIAELAKRLPAVLMRDMMSNDRRYWEKLQKIRQERIFKIIEGIIVTSREDGLIRADIQTPLLTTLLFASVEAIANPTVLTRLPFETREVIDGLINMLFQGILSESGRTRMAEAKPISSIQALEAIIL